MITQFVPPFLSLSTAETANLIEIKIGTNYYLIEKSIIEKDFANFDELFKKSPHYVLCQEYEFGWKFLFHCLDPHRFDVPPIDTFDEYKQVVDCIIFSGSKKALQQLQLSALPPNPRTLTEMWQFYRSIEKNYPPNANAEIDTLLVCLHSSFSTLTLTLRSPNPNEFFVRGKQYRQLRLTMLPHDLVCNFSDSFPKVTKLIIKKPYHWKTLSLLLEHASKIELLKLKVFSEELIYLDEITKNCPFLTTLHIKGTAIPQAAAKKLCGVSPIAATKLPTSLRVLSLNSLNILPGVISSVAKMATLEMLDLQSSFIDPIRELERLTQCTNLRIVDLTNTRCAGPHPHALLGQAHLLRKKMPMANLFPETTIEDFTQYAKVLSLTPCKSHPYQFPADDSKVPSLESLKTLLTSCLEHLNWSIQIGQSENNQPLNLSYPPYDHKILTNLGFYFSASPIVCPDNRLRIATQEPFDEITCGDFWQAVLELDVSVIAMVKEATNSSYLPDHLCTLKFTGQKGLPIEVTCLSVQPLAHAITLRELLVANKKITHLQIDWQDMQGIDEKRLSYYVEQFEQLESLTTGASIVHCKAGIGRTGTFFAAIILKQLLRNSPKTPLNINLEALLFGLRQQRMGMILTDTQLMTVRNYFIHEHIQHLESNSSLQHPLAV